MYLYWVRISYLLLLLEVGLAFLTLLLLALAFLQQSLRDEDLVFSWDAPVDGKGRQGQYSLSASRME